MLVDFDLRIEPDVVRHAVGRDQIVAFASGGFGDRLLKGHVAHRALTLDRDARDAERNVRILVAERVLDPDAMFSAGENREPSLESPLAHLRHVDRLDASGRVARGVFRQDQLAAQHAAGRRLVAQRLEVGVVGLNREHHRFARLIAAAIGACDETFLHSQGVAQRETMDHLAPELAVILLAILTPQAPCLVESQVHDLAMAETPHGDHGLPGSSVGTGVGGMFRQRDGHGMQAIHGLIPRERPQVVPCPGILGRAGAELHEVDLRRLGTQLEREGFSLADARGRIDDDREHLGQGRLGKLPRPEPRTGQHDQSAAEVVDEFLGHAAESGAEARGGQVAH